MITVDKTTQAVKGFFALRLTSATGLEKNTLDKSYRLPDVLKKEFGQLIQKRKALVL